MLTPTRTCVIKFYIITNTEEGLHDKCLALKTLLAEHGLTLEGQYSMPIMNFHKTTGERTDYRAKLQVVKPKNVTRETICGLVNSVQVVPFSFVYEEVYQ